MNKNYIIVGSLGIVGLIVGGYFIFKPKYDPNNPKIDDDLYMPTPKKGMPLVGCSDNDKFPLRKKTFHTCSYDNVKKLQQILNSKSLSPLLPLKEDGKFGANTLERLESIFNVSTVSKQLFDTEVSKLTLDSMIPNLYLGYADLKSIPIL